MTTKSEFRTESRSVALKDAEVKGRDFRGYAAVFDSPWNERLVQATGYIEKTARGAFRKVLNRGDDVPLLLGHEGKHMLLARTGSGTMRLQEDGKGLLCEAKLPDNFLGEYARSMIESGDLQAMSYGVKLDPHKDTYLTRSESGVYTRTIAAIRELIDVSLTWEPAYEAATVELRSAGFVATPLQELLAGTEVQSGDGGKGEPPDDAEPDAWWGDHPAEAEEEAKPTDGSRPWWDTYIQELEREV